MSTDPLGLKSGTVTLVPYDNRWPALFDEASREIANAFGPGILTVHHVGSTSIPGMCAKPILDILVSIADLDRGLALVPGLAGLGYEFRPAEEIPDRHYFRRRRGDVRTHHLSLAEPASHHHRVTLAFRDALRADPALAAEYATLKIQLAQRFPRDRQAYIEGKTAFIEGVLRGAGGVDRRMVGP